MDHRTSLTQLITLLENKDRLIDKLALTDEQKDRLKAYFKKYPTSESKIDWNRKDLRWEDFQEILALEGTTKSSQKKYGISGKAQIEDLVEGKDYEIIEQNDDYIAYYVKTFKGSEVLAKPTTPPLGVTGKWCIAGRNYSPGTRDQHWDNYIGKGYKFIYVFTKETKYALACPNGVACLDGSIECFDCGDHQIECPEEYGQLADYFLSKEQKFWKNLRKKDKVIIPEGITSIPEKAFEGSSIKEVIIPDSVTFIDSWAFSDCTSLTSITIPDSVTSIGKFAFYGCTGLKSVIIGNSVINIENFVFNKCTGLTNITIPNSIKSIGVYAFHGCTGLKSVIIGNSVTSIGNCSFFGCTSLTSITIPDSVTSIGPYAFYGCSGLTNITMGNSVTSIGASAFNNCIGLMSVTISNSVASIGNRSFWGCTGLTNIVFSGTKAQWNAINKEEDRISRLPWNYEVPATAVHCIDGNVQLIRG